MRLRQEAQRRGLIPQDPKEESPSKAPCPHLSDFTEATTYFTLDPWQHVLCQRLERLKHEKGQRVLIHAPPQAGKSCIISQRFPAYLLGDDPLHRVKLACHNISHATSFGSVVRDLMWSETYKEFFPAPTSRIPDRCGADAFFTNARRGLRDAQPSFMAMGLLSGFVGQGADTLIIDDPYASPQDAYSEEINKSVWMFWEESAKVRIHEDTNVVVMFHRYWDGDLAGRLWDTGQWEMLRFAAIADGDALWPDPLGRRVGEKLSPRVSDEYLAEQQKVAHTWFGQFQGRPIPLGGGMFKQHMFEIVGAVPPIARRVRYWDKAGTHGGGAYTAGVLMALDFAGQVWVEDVVRGQWSEGEREAMIKLTAERDARKYGNTVQVWIEREPGSSGKEGAQSTVKNLIGFPAFEEPVTGDKETRARPLAAQLTVRPAKLLRADWNDRYIKECCGFPRGLYKDQVDASSGAFNKLILINLPGTPVAGGSRPMVRDFKPR